MRRRTPPRKLTLEHLEIRANPALLTVSSLADTLANDGQFTLREAIAAVNAQSSAGLDAGAVAQISGAFGSNDTIQFTGLTGTITLGSGEFALSKNVTLTGPGASQLTLSGNNASRIMNVGAGFTVNVSGLTFTQGRRSNVNGGAVVNNGTLSLTDVSFVGNSVMNNNNGGAIHNNNTGTLTVTRGTFTNNSAEQYGGAIRNVGTATIVDSTFDGNSAQFDGGAIASNDSLTIERSTFAANESKDGSGGALVVSAGATVVKNSTFSGNLASFNGGAINANGNSSATLVVTNSTFTGNHANSLDLNPTSVSGTISVFGGHLVTLHNTLVVGNYLGSGTGTLNDIASTLQTACSNNLIGNASTAGGLTNNVNGNKLGFTASAVLNSTLADNGGSTKTHALIANSPALNAGSNTAATNAGLTTDQRGTSVARIANGTVDIGAFEMQSLNLVVDTPVDEDDGNYSTGDLSLREAVRLANTNPAADTITFAPTVTTVSLTNYFIGSLTLTDTALTTITGNGVIVERGSIAPLLRIFTVDTGAQASFQGLTIRNGYASGGSGITNSGTLTIINSTVSENRGSLNPGGITNFGTLTITNSTVSENWGGGIINRLGGTLTITNSTVSGNYLSDLGGGGIINSEGTLTVTDSTISGNSSKSIGGGIYNHQGTLTITNSTLTNNRADSDGDSFGSGGGIYTLNNTGVTTTLFNTIVAGNFVGTGTTASDISNDVDSKNVESTSSNNLIGDAGTAGGLTNATNGNKVGVAVATVLDPTLANNGGPTLTHSLKFGSPAINAGSNTNIPNGVTTDQRGAGFIRVVGSNVDIGAVEAQDIIPPTVIITPPAVGASPLVFTFQFNEPITGFTASDLVVTNGTAAEPVAGGNNLYTVTVTPTATRLVVTVTLPAGMVSDLAGNTATASSNVATGNYSSSDVNRDGKVDIADILIEVYYFNTLSESNQLPYDVSQLAANAPKIDASGNGQFDLFDLLRVVFAFNDAQQNPEGESAIVVPAIENTSAADLSPAASGNATTTATDALFADESLAWLSYEGLRQKRRRGA